MKIITVKSRTLLLLVVALLLLVLLLSSCTMQKRLYRPGVYVERHSDKAAHAETETETAARAERETETEKMVLITPGNNTVAANKLPVKTAAEFAPATATHKPAETAAVKNTPVLKRIVAAPKQLRKRIVKKQTWSSAKITEDQGYTLAIIGGIILLVILVIIGYSIGDPLFVLKAIVIGWYILQALAALAVLGLIIYGIWWLFDFMDGGCGF